MAVIALVHASEGSFDTRPTALVNSAPSGLTFSNIGSDSNGGGQFWFGGEGPYGQALRTEGESGAGVAIVCDQTFSFGKGMTHEGFTSGFDDSGREFWEIRENVTDFPTWWIRVRCIPVTGTTWRLWLQVKLPGYDLLEVESSTFTETSPTNGHWIVTQWNDDGTFSLHVEGTRVLLTTETFDTTLTGAKLAIFGSYRGTYAGGFYSQLVGEFRFSTHQVYSGATLTVPTARFPNPANQAAAAQTLGGLVSSSAAKLPVRIPGGGSIGAFDAAVFDATVFDIGVINAQTLGGITQVATATAGAGAGPQIAAAQTLGGVSQGATVKALAKAAAGQTLGGIVSSATTKALAKATSARSLGGVTQTATATVTTAGTRVASAAQTLGPVVQTASATSSMRAAAAQTLGGIAQTAAAKVALSIPGGGGTGGPTLSQNSGTLRGASVNSAVHTWASPPVIGQKLIVMLAGWRSGTAPTLTVTDNATPPNTYTARIDSSFGATRTIFYECVVASIPTQTIVSFSASSYFAGTFSAWDGLGSYDTFSTSTGLSTGPTSTLAQPNEVLFTLVGGTTGSSASNFVPPSGYSALGIENNSSAYIGMGSAFSIVATDAPATAAWTASGASSPSLQTHLVAFRAASTVASVGQLLGSIAQTATATVTAAGTRLASASQTLGPIAQAATLTSSMRLAAAQTLGGIAQTATAKVPPLSGISAFQVLGGPVSAATAKVLARAAAAQTMGGISSQAAAVVLAVRLAAASQTLGGISQAATASLASRASAAQTMAGLLASAQLSSALALAGAQQLGGVQPAATATVADTVYRLQAAQIMGAIQQFARVQHDYVFVRDERTYVVNPSDRTHVVGASNRRFIITPADRTFAVTPSNRTLIVE